MTAPYLLVVEREDGRVVVAPIDAETRGAASSQAVSVVCDPSGLFAAHGPTAVRRAWVTEVVAELPVGEWRR